MTVQDNLNLIMEMYEALNNKDYDHAYSLHSEEHLRYDARWEEPLRGLKDYRKYGEDFMNSFPDFQIEVVSAFGQGDLVCDEHISSGTHTKPMKTQEGKTIPPSGNRFKVRSCHIYKIHEGKIVETSIYIDQMGLLAQLGLAT
jgi:steroid delta-isomerase-like uncharacterized protein